MVWDPAIAGDASSESFPRSGDLRRLSHTDPRCRRVTTTCAVWAGRAGSSAFTGALQSGLGDRTSGCDGCACRATVDPTRSANTSTLSPRSLRGGARPRPQDSVLRCARSSPAATVRVPAHRSLVDGRCSRTKVPESMRGSGPPGPWRAQGLAGRTPGLAAPRFSGASRHHGEWLGSSWAGPEGSSGRQRGLGRPLQAGSAAPIDGSSRAARSATSPRPGEPCERSTQLASRSSRPSEVTNTVPRSDDWRATR